MDKNVLDKKYSKISFKFILTIGPILLLGGSLIMFYIVSSEIKQFNNQVEEKIKLVNDIILEGTYKIMTSGQSNTKSFMDRISLMKGISNLKLIKSAGVAKQYGAGDDEKPVNNEEMQALKGLIIKRTEEENGIQYFKEISPIKFNESCLKCHEGKADDIAAALSITFSLEESNKAIKVRQKVLVLIFIVCFAAVIIILYYLINKFIIDPISTISKASNLIATQGDLTSQIKKDSNDEIGQLSDLFNYMVERLKNLVQQIQSAGLRIGSASAEFLASSQQQASGATQQAAAVSEITATIEELSNTASQIAENSDSVVKISEQTFHRAEAGYTAVEDTIKGMEDIRNKAQQTAEKIVVLGERSQEIGEVIDIIDDIANQTKLLSLNAAIEAAKAGEYGKGFAVVAVEIRLLAENVVKSTTKIKNIVNEIQGASNASVMATEQSMKKIEDGVILAKKAGEGLKEILEIAEQTTSEAKQISSSIQQQKSANEQVYVSMKEISDVTRQLAGGAKEGTSAASELNKLAEELKIAINQFKTKS